jgi:chromosome segregation ATPase
MRPDRSQAMRDARRLDGQRKHALVIAATTAALHAGRQPTIAGIARAAGVGRKFIYDHGDLRAEIELKAAQATQHQANDMIAAARVTGASLRADLENSKAQNRRLQAQVRALEQRLSQAEGARLIADDLLPEDIVAQMADSQLARRINQIEQELFEATERLRRTDEELDAARAINRELMQKANRPDRQTSTAPARNDILASPGKPG